MTRLSTCSEGHSFSKTSDCPVCPVCEKKRKPNDGFLQFLSAPARRALENEAIFKLEKLVEFRESELLKLHGFGKSSLPILRKLLAEKNLHFNSEK